MMAFIYIDVVNDKIDNQNKKAHIISQHAFTTIRNQSLDCRRQMMWDICVTANDKWCGIFVLLQTTNDVGYLCYCKRQMMWDICVWITLYTRPLFFEYLDIVKSNISK